MTDYAGEQEMEVQALEAILMDDFQVLSENPYKLQLHCIPIPIPADDEENHVGINLIFDIPETYPDVVPEIEIVPTMGLTDEDKLAALTSLVNEEAPNNIGMAMCYTLYSVAQEWLLQNNEKELDMHEQMMQRLNLKKQESEAEIQKEEERKREGGLSKELLAKRAAGTQVTVETFNAWRAKFEKEMEKSEGKKRAGKGDKSKPTGRQMFERDISLVQSDAKFAEEEGGDDVDYSTAAINAELFDGDDDDEDLLTDSDDEDEEDEDDDGDE
eukprot:GFYU01011288.1.p1 GENE.GFYU01011288.1~~GFYU01011288.1.p1  ORF type:complete len:271 (-),score=105.53 GFYU01011288.1:85-897(-)